MSAVPTPSNIIDYRDEPAPDTNMYGVTACPECGSKYRDTVDNGTIRCGCGHEEKGTVIR